jgi:hypothetical protein
MTKIAVPHESGEAFFAYPSHGPETYGNVGAQILTNGQNVPTGDQTASLVYAAYCVPETNDEPEFKDVRKIMRNRWLWVFNRNLWTPEGVYVVQDLEAIGRSQQLDTSELEKQLKGGKDANGIRFSRDRTVRFAPKGSYKLGGHTPESLAKDGFLIASYGLEGAEKLGEVSTRFKYKPKTLGIEIQEEQKPELRLSALIGNRGLGGRLVVDGYNFDGGRHGHAFGVLK